MKFKTVCFFSCLIFLATMSFAQTPAKEKNKFSALPENASLEETQAWLVRAINQNGFYTSKVTQTVKDPGKAAKNETGNADTKISEVKFEGSIMTYRMDHTTQLNPGASTSKNPPERERVKVQIDLKDINPEEVTLQDIEPGKNVQAISLRTFEYKRTIKLKSSDSGEVGVSVANIVVEKNIADEIQTALIHAIKLCQEAKP